MAEWLRRGLQILFVYDLTLIISLLINIFTFNKDCKYSPVPLIQSPLLKAKPLGFGEILWKNQVQSLSTIANQNSREFRWLVSEPSLNEAHSGSNFQSFPRGQSPPLEKNYYSFSLYCLIQTASLFKNILGFLVKVEKIIKKIL